MGEIAVSNCAKHGRFTYDMFNGTKEDRICPKCRGIRKSIEEEYKMKNGLQKAIDQVGMDAVQKSITHSGMTLGFCDLHGHYLFSNPATCPLCPNPNGASASDIEHVIDIKEAISPTAGTNPGQKLNPTGITERDIERMHEDSNGNRTGK